MEFKKNIELSPKKLPVPTIWLKMWKLNLSFNCLQNWIPRTEFPRASNGGEKVQSPRIPGTTTIIAPDTPLLAGSPTYNTIHCHFSIFTNPTKRIKIIHEMPFKK